MKCGDGNVPHSTKWATSLAETANWTAYVDSDFAEKGMGGPTLEMFVKSYNGKYQKDKGKSLVYKTYGVGYLLGWKNEGVEESDVVYSDYIYGLEGEGFYYLSDYSKACAYWLASPALSGNEYVMFVNRNGNYTYYDDYWYSITGVRPVVCLKADVKVTSTTTDGETTWDITE